jgi:hypothetical protein
MIISLNNIDVFCIINWIAHVGEPGKGIVGRRYIDENAASYKLSNIYWVSGNKIQSHAVVDWNGQQAFLKCVSEETTETKAFDVMLFAEYITYCY